MHNRLIFRQIYKSKPFGPQIQPNYLIVNAFKEL